MKRESDGLISHKAREWLPIESAPRDGTAVLVFFARRVWLDENGNPVSFGDLRDQVERTEIGFYQDGDWLESGTAHSMFEDWRQPGDFPTHWMPLPSPPPIKDSHDKGDKVG